MEPQKIIFLDIDGTLCEPGKNTPPASALDAISKAQNAGNKVFLCTGRNLGMLKPLLAYSFDGIVASAGGYILCGNTVINNTPMTKEQQELVMGIMRKHNVLMTVECKDQTYTDDAFKPFLAKIERKTGNSELLRWREVVEKNLNIHPFSAYKGEPVYKLVLMCESMEQLKEPQKLLSYDYNLDCFFNARFGYVNGEISPKLYDKGKGIRMVCDYLNIPIENSYGYGDSLNDREMIKTVGHGVVMANGNDDIKLLADEICPSVSDNGIYQSFEKNNLF